MNMCLVTKLKGIVNNESLLKLSEFRFKIDKVQSPSKNNRSFAIDVNSSMYVRIIGEGYFTNEDLSENKGKSLLLNPESINCIYVSNNDVEVSIENKYNIERFYCEAVSDSWLVGTGHKNIHIDINDFKYSNALTSLNLADTTLTGDIAAIKNLTALAYLNLENTTLIGDIAAIKNLTALTYLNLENTTLTGDIAAIKNLTALETIYLRNSNTSGDISVLSSLSKLKECQLDHITGGDITVLNNTLLTMIIIANSGGLTGDIAKLKSDFTYLGTNRDNTSKFTWSSRDVNSKIFGNGGTPIISTSLDDMLINMAQCRNSLTSGSSTWEKNISYQGNRTSASDAAVEKLQGYGYTISINKA